MDKIIKIYKEIMTGIGIIGLVGFIAGLFHEGFQTTSFIMNLLSVGSESGHPAAFTAFFLFSCPHLKKCAKHPLYLIYTFFQILYT